MTENEFWKLIGKHVIRQSNGGIDARPLAKVLDTRPPEEILSFQRHMSKHFAESYTWRLWGAAHLIQDGAPDDTFDYFRSWLIGCGRDVFLAAMDDPDSLADFATPEAIDDLLYGVGQRTYEKVTGKSLPSSGIKRPKLKKNLDFNDPDAMARAYPRLFAQFGGSLYAANPYDDLLERCRAYAGAKKERWTEKDVAGFFQRFRPRGEGLSEIYAGVEHGDQIVERLVAAMEVDGTTEGSTLSANNLVPVTGDEAMALAQRFCENVRELAVELSNEELAERFTAGKFVLRAGARDRYELNDLTDEAIEMLWDTMYDVFYESASPASVLNTGVRALVGGRLLPFYIQWPVCSGRVQISDPLAPLFEMWRRGVAWRIVENRVVEVFTP